MEVYGGIGVSNFLGELGGRNAIGTHYSPVDLETSLTRSAITAGFKYKVQRWFTWVSSFDYLIVRGNDALTGEPVRFNRNLNFKSNIFELSTKAQAVWVNSKTGHRYGVKKNLSRRIKNSSWDLGGYLGIGVFYYNPKGKDQTTGKYVKLLKLHTEGQGLPGGPKQYKRVGLCIPIGVVYHIYITPGIVLGAEINFRKTFTDYIDDVSTKYYDPAALTAAYGPQSAQMADPSKGLIPGATSPDAYGESAQRGNPHQKDAYMSFQLTCGYVLKSKKAKARLRSKF